MSSILVIDSGNSYIKWGLQINYQWVRKGKVFYNDIFLLKKEFASLPQPKIIVISHVARSVTRSQLNLLISIWPISPHWVIAQSFQCNVFNDYSDPTQFGSDRWAALIAAWEILHTACLVINVGTAVTIDALSDSGRFLGGIILPGPELIFNSLLSGTQLTNIRTGNYKTFPLNTNDGIQSGVIHCLIGTFERMHNLLSLRLKHPIKNWIISGGGASVLTPYIKFPIIAVDNIVLEGLAIIANDILIQQKDY
jgi:type III pantothenate kinase